MNYIIHATFAVKANSHVEADEGFAYMLDACEGTLARYDTEIANVEPARAAHAPNRLYVILRDEPEDGSFSEYWTGSEWGDLANAAVYTRAQREDVTTPVPSGLWQELPNALSVEKRARPI